MADPRKPKGKQSKSFASCVYGGTAIEYSLIAAAIAIAMSVVLFGYSGEMNTVLQNLIGVIQNIAWD